MALGNARNTEQEKHYPSIANSIFPSKVDDNLINASMSTHSESKFWGLGIRLARTFQEDTTSTESGDDDLSHIHCVSASLTSEDSEVSDDEKLFTPRSTSSEDATYCMYSVVFLLQARAACCKGDRGTGRRRSVLGYGTEEVPFKAPRSPTLNPTAKATPKSPKTPKQAKQNSKEASKARPCRPAPERTQQLALPTADSWIARQRARAISVDGDNEQVLRAARSILNKLTVEKFESLLCQLVDCGIRTPLHVTLLMREVFEKATTQHQFIPMYAELCVRLEKDPRIMFAVKQAEPLQDFRRLLLDQCQDVFEQMLTPCAIEGIIDEQTQRCRKQRALGNVKLVGELLVRGMLGSVLFVECSRQLLQSRNTCPEALECLAALLMVAGPKFDKQSWSHYERLIDLFSAVDVLTRDKSTPTRLRFLLRDVLDTRGAGWSTSANQAALKAAPMKLEAVREKAAEENGVTASKHGVASPKHQNIIREARSPTAGPVRSPPAADEVRALVAERFRTALGPDTVRSSKQEKPMTTRSRKRGSKGDAKASNANKLSAADVANVLRNALGNDQQEDRRPRCATVSEVKSAKQNEMSKRQSSPTSPPVELPCADVAAEEFDLVAFRRTLSTTLTKLSQDKNVAAAVQYIRLQQVPPQFQADQFVDILSRIVEERRGAIRRCEFAFAAGLAAAEDSPFERCACFEGIRLFFEDVYGELCQEIQRLPGIMKSEFLPTMYGVFGAADLKHIVPEEVMN